MDTHQMYTKSEKEKPFSVTNAIAADRPTCDERRSN